MSRSTVRHFYENFPYPMRAIDHVSSATILPSSFDAVRHHLFDGHWPAGRPFRALVAGGGTGDAVVSLGLSMQRRGVGGSIHYIDLSAASADIARRRAEAAGVRDVTFEVGPIESVVGTGRFDYVDLSGVLPIIADPGALLEVLARAVSDDGGIGVMSYGRLGRHGVEPFREMHSLLAGG